MIAQAGGAQIHTPCPVIEALISDDPQSRAGVAAVLNQRGLIDVSKNGAGVTITDATDCELYSQDFSLSCKWPFSAGELEQAQAQIDALRQRLDACLPNPLREQVPRQYIAAIEPVQEWRLIPAGRNPVATEIRLELDRYTDRGNLAVKLTIGQD